MHGRIKKSVVIISIIVLLCILFLILLLNSEHDNFVKNLIIGKTAIEDELDDVSDSDNSGFDEDDVDLETRYLKYLKQSNSFVKKDVREKKDVFCFAGDVFFSNKVQAGYDKEGVNGILEESYQKLLNSADLSMANLECCITDDIGSPAEKKWTFALPTKYAKGLREIGIDLFTLANNHILDYGMNALLNTVNELDKESIGHIGAGETLYDAKKVYIKEIDGKRYAILAASAVLPYDSWKADDEKGGVYNGYDIVSLVAEIRLIKPFFDKVIVYMHWGNEYENVSNEFQNKTAHHIVNAGADLIIGTHSHTIQEIEYYNNVPIVYSLGNFIYGGQVRDIMMAEVTFDYSNNVSGDIAIRLYPGVSSYQKTKRYWGRDQLNNMFLSISEKSKGCYVDNDGYVHVGKHPYIPVASDSSLINLETQIPQEDGMSFSAKVEYK